MGAIFAFLLLICVLVFVHEYGHFWAARRCGVKVIRFSIGFGKVLFKRIDKQGTEFAFSLIPLGGYVQMYNGEPDISAPANSALANKTLWQRAFIVIAGPLANFLFALIAYWIVFTNGIPNVKPVISNIKSDTIAAAANLPKELEITQINQQAVQDWEEITLALISAIGQKNVELQGHLIDETHTQHFQLDLSNWTIDANKENPLLSLGIVPKSSEIKPEIKNVAPQSVAEKAGVKAGDKILAFNQKNFDWSEMVDAIQTGKEIDLSIMRAGEIKQFHLKPEFKEMRYIIGITPDVTPLADKYRTELKYDMLSAFSKSLEKIKTLTQSIIKFIGNLITGNLSINNLSGPISMAKGASATAEIGWVYYLSFMALISVNLGVMNLFPLLPLDGGQLVLFGLEALRGKPLSENLQQGFQYLGVAIVLSLMFFALINDLIHF